MIDRNMPEPTKPRRSVVNKKAALRAAQKYLLAAVTDGDRYCVRWSGYTLVAFRFHPDSPEYAQGRRPRSKDFPGIGHPSVEKTRLEASPATIGDDSVPMWFYQTSRPKEPRRESFTFDGWRYI